MRRAAGSRQLLCSTNGCTTFMQIDEARSAARCPICGSVRRVNATARTN
jgi:hypothetical protein